MRNKMIELIYSDFNENNSVFFDLVINSECINIDIYLDEPITYNVKVDMELIMNNLLELEKEHNIQLSYHYPDTITEQGVRYITLN